MTRRLAVLLVTSAIVGCASQGGPAWISASKFDYDEYSNRHVAVVPVTFAESIDTQHFPAQPLQQAVADELTVFGMRDVTPVEYQTENGVSFPATPKRLSAFGTAHHYDAVVGVTIVRFEHRPQVRGWSFTGNITFADAVRPDRRWTLAKTWRFTDEPGRNSSYFELDNAMIDDFFDVRRALQRGTASMLLRRDTVIVDLGPALNLDVADAPRQVSKPTLKSASNQQEQEILSTSAPVAQVDVLAIDDDGIANLTVGASSGFQTVVYDKIPSSLSSNPIYVAQRVAVPLQPGENEIRAVGTNGIGQKVVRSLFVRRNQDESQKGLTEVILVVADSYMALPPDVLQQGSSDTISEMKSHNGGVSNGFRVLALTDQGATRAGILRMVTGEWTRPANGAHRRVVFVGRAEVIEGRPYLLLYEADKEHPDIGSISVDEITALAKFDVDQFDLDLCTNGENATAVQQAIEQVSDDGRKQMLSAQNPVPPATRFKVSVVAGCSAPIGATVHALVKPAEG